ncbi:hypothetical protein HPB48_015391 [Haemaphysalis longicornis]|uniref:Uncharacterized protein n=1 Tax=Haemaphysalis longicornis TaxID=44386 RepID=A0A9J6H4C8_HAELO|nr:hypothetical protein HPB48_015391 [Haemaphysalis longicornis]
MCSVANTQLKTGSGPSFFFFPAQYRTDPILKLYGSAKHRAKQRSNGKRGKREGRCSGTYRKLREVGGDPALPEFFEPLEDVLKVRSQFLRVLPRQTIQVSSAPVL